MFPPTFDKKLSSPERTCTKCKDFECSAVMNSHARGRRANELIRTYAAKEGFSVLDFEAVTYPLGPEFSRDSIYWSYGGHEGGGSKRGGGANCGNDRHIGQSMLTDLFAEEICGP